MLIAGGPATLTWLLNARAKWRGAGGLISEEPSRVSCVERGAERPTRLTGS